MGSGLIAVFNWAVRCTFCRSRRVLRHVALPVVDDNGRLEFSRWHFWTIYVNDTIEYMDEVSCAVLLAHFMICGLRIRSRVVLLNMSW